MPGKRGVYQFQGKKDLTARQLQTLQCVRRGMIDREIGAAMYIHEQTAKRHVRDILAKLDARNSAHAIDIAYRKGIFTCQD